MIFKSNFLSYIYDFMVLQIFITFFINLATEDSHRRSWRSREAAQEASGVGSAAGAGLPQPGVPRGGPRGRLGHGAAEAAHLLPQLRVRAHAVDRLHTRFAGLYSCFGLYVLGVDQFTHFLCKTVI